MSEFLDISDLMVTWEEGRNMHFANFHHLKKLPKGAKVLFICVGNINRSPACEIIAKDQLNWHHTFKWEITSAAISEKNKGKPMSKKMRDVLKEMGYEFETPRSKPITKEMVDNSDVIFIMDGANERKLVDKFGEQILSKIQYIGDWNTSNERNISDPHFHSGNSEHIKVGNLLEGSVHNLIEYHQDFYDGKIE